MKKEEILEKAVQRASTKAWNTAPDRGENTVSVQCC